MPLLCLILQISPSPTNFHVREGAGTKDSAFTPLRFLHNTRQAAK